MDLFVLLEEFDYWLDLSRFVLPFLAVFLISTSCSAQQNLFNVPSAEITRQGNVFFQQQFNLTKVQASNTTIDYGLGRNFEVGANFFFDSDSWKKGSTASNPIVLGNGQKSFEVNRFQTVSIGTQTGFSPNARDGSLTLAEFSYFMNAFDFDKKGKYYLGGYLANHTYGAGSNPGGFLAGFDIPILPEWLNVIADLISGDGKMAVAVGGICAQVTEDWQLSLGAQMPAPESHNPSGVVLELTNLHFSF